MFNDKSFPAKVYAIDKEIKIVNGLQVAAVSSQILGDLNLLTPSLIVDCYIHTGKLTPLEYLERIWQRMVN